MFWKAYNENDEMYCFAGRVNKDEQDEAVRIELLNGAEAVTGSIFVRTGSAQLVAAKIESLRTGEIFRHWQHGRVKVVKINKKTVRIQPLGSSEIIEYKV